MIYADTSALLKRYVDEPDSVEADRLLGSDTVLVTSWVTLVIAQHFQSGSESTPALQDDDDKEALASRSPTHGRRRGHGSVHARRWSGHGPRSRRA